MVQGLGNMLGVAIFRCCVLQNIAGQVVLYGKEHYREVVKKVDGDIEVVYF